MKQPQVIVITYADEKRNVLQLDVDASPVTFVDASGQVLNVRGRFSPAHEFTWHYFPLCNIKHYHKQNGDAA